MFWKRVIVHHHERVLVIKNGRVAEILTPGDHWIFVLPGVSFELERHDIRDLVLRSRWTDYLLGERPDLVQCYFTAVETNDVQVAMVYVDTKLFRILTPAKSLLFWRGEANISAEIVEVVETDMPEDMLLELERDA